MCGTGHGCAIQEALLTPSGRMFTKALSCRLYHLDGMYQITAIGDHLGPSPLPEVGVEGGGVAENPNPLLTELIPWPPARILRPVGSHLISTQRKDT